MTFDEFSTLIKEMGEEIPSEFMVGLQGVHVLKELRVEEEYEDVVRLGEYLDPGPADFLGAGEGLGRHIALYYGSFAAIAEGEPGFD